MLEALRLQCSKGVERIKNPDRLHFATLYLARARPVIITGAMANWSAHGTWNFSHIARASGSRQVIVQHYPTGNRCRFGEHRSVSMPLCAYLDRVASRPEDRRFYYLASARLGDVLPELRHELQTPRVVDTDVRNEQYVFMGWESFSQLHYHRANHSVLSQLQGSKEVVLFPPVQTSLLYPYAWHSHLAHFSRIDFENFPRERHPRFLLADGLRCVLKPGEMLYIPVHWWHAVHGYEENISVTTSWKAALGHWQFPTPGWRTLCNRYYRRLATRTRR